MIKAIFALDSNGGLGKNGSLPWPKDKKDLAWFKQHTVNNVVVMGRATWDDAMMPKPLPNRINVIITNRPLDQEHQHFDNVFTMNGDVSEILYNLQSKYQDKDIFVIGGANLLMQCQPLIQQVILTNFEFNYDCDVKLDLDSFFKDFTLDWIDKGEHKSYNSIWNRTI